MKFRAFLEAGRVVVTVSARNPDISTTAIAATFGEALEQVGHAVRLAMADAEDGHD